MINSDRLLSRAELVLLGLFAVALPLVEAPKNVFWGLFVIVWLANSLRLRNVGQLAWQWDALFAALVAAPLLSMAHTVYAPHWKELGDIAGYVSLGWILARTRVSGRQLLALCGALILATLAGVAQGAWMLAFDAHREWLQLNSVGHVNHSALYGAGVCVLAVALVASGREALGRKGWQLAVAAALLLLAAMVAFASRGAMIAALAGVMLVVACLARCSLRKAFSILFVALLFGAAGQWGMSHLIGKGGQSLMEKTVTGFETGQVSSYRVQAVHTAVEMFRRYPLTGVGSGGFSSVSPEELAGWLRERGEEFVPADYLFSSHAHGLFPNTLAERGVVGFLVLLALLAAWSVALWQRRPGAEAAFAVRLSWGAGAAGWAVVFVGGLFNTTLHHEHGMLAMSFLGLLLSGAPLRAKAAV